MITKYSEKTLTAIKTMQSAVWEAESARKEGLPYAGKGELLETANKAAIDANKAIMADAIAHFRAIATESKAAFIAAYFKDWTVDGYKVVQDTPEDGAAIHTDNKTLRVAYSAIDSMDASFKTPIASDGAWRSYLQIYGDNVFQYIADNSKGESALSAKTALPSHLIEKRKAKGGCWAKHSHSALVEQLNDLCKMIFPADFQPEFHMVSVDQKVITASISNAKRLTENGAATLQLAKVNTLENILFTEIYTRMNNLAINLETGLKEHKTKTTAAPVADEGKGGDVQDGSKPVPADDTAA